MSIFLSLKIVFFFSQFSATHPFHVKEQLILARDPSVQSLLLVDDFCTANGSPVLAKERSQNIVKSWKKTIFTEHPVCLIDLNLL